MTRLLSMLALMMMTFAVQAAPLKKGIEWLSYNGKAFEKAEQVHVPLLLFVTASWCKHCQKMDQKTLRNPKVEGYIKRNFVTVEATTEDLAVISRYKITELPVLIVLDSTGNILESFTGYKNSRETMKVLMRAYRKSKA